MTNSKILSLSLFLLSTAALADEVTWGLAATRIESAWQIGGYGRGARVMVADSSVDTENPDLAGQIEAMKDFSGGWTLSAKPDPHGTHVAGIIAAKRDGHGLVGVAPESKLLVARVCKEEDCSPSGVTKALKWAIEQKVDVVNLSLSRDTCPSDMKKTLQEAEAQGIVIVAATGNLNKDRLPCPANLETVISVGAVNEDLQRAVWEGQNGTGGSNYGTGLALVAPGDLILSTLPVGTGFVSRINAQGFGSLRSVPIEGSPTTTQPLVAALADAGFGTSSDLDGLDVKGKILLVERGNGKFREKAARAQKAGAIAVVVFNNERSLYPGVLGGTQTVPILMIEREAGLKLREQLKLSPVTAQFILEQTDYGYRSGTSMAAPFVTGVVALMRSVNPSLTPAQIRSIIKSQAHSLGNEFELGAGLLDAAAAVRAAASARE